MKATNLMIGGLALLAGGFVYFLWTKRRQDVGESILHQDNGHSEGKQILRRVLHKAKHSGQ
jgi:LPXTG-motif cell wall-anchored protein